MNDGVIHRKYKIEKFIGNGKFGRVYQGYNIKTNEIVAIKLESSDAPCKILKNETTILNYLYRKGCKCVPFIYWFGLYLENSTLVMTYYEYSLDQYITNHHYSPADSNRILKSMLKILEQIHSHFIIHRDIKPHNFMMRDGELYLIDFGMATSYSDTDEERTGKTDILGTPKYISIHIHNGVDPSRRDDVISACYIYLQMRLGYLPWDQARFTQTESKKIKETDVSTEINIWRKSLKSWVHIEPIAKELDAEFLLFLNSAYLTEFKDAPRYTFFTPN